MELDSFENIINYIEICNDLVLLPEYLLKTKNYKNRMKKIEKYAIISMDKRGIIIFLRLLMAK